MKLRNKKTGEILDITLIANQGYLAEHEVKTYYDEPISLKVLERYFEDYIQAEPLIKDEKIRKAVRAWAEANNIDEVSHDACWNAFRCHDFVIGFDYDFDRHDGLKDGNAYAIAELCGEDK